VTGAGAPGPAPSGLRSEATREDGASQAPGPARAERAPASTAEGVVIAHVSDLHLGAHEPAVLDTLVADVAAAGPALTVVTGDCTMRARDGQFRLAQSLLARLPLPRLVVLGNHDVPLALPARFTRPYARYRQWLCADLDPVVRMPGLTALGLNSMPRWRWKSGGVTGRQTAAVVDLLGGAARDGIRLLALHHPPFAGGLARLVGRDRLARALVEARVDLVLSGHTHVPLARRVALAAGGATHHVVEVVAGTATSRRTRGTRRSWSVIRVRGDGVVVQDRYEEADHRWRTGRTVRFARTP
jgi:3',5'-cyclic AMP phosphodiesterase CpdA